LPAVERTLAALAAAAEHGLDPSQYEPGLAGQWRALKSAPAPPAERALFDVALSVASARILKAVAIGRIDPSAMQWGYPIKPRTRDSRGLLREVRDGTGLAAAMDSVQPPVAHYARARRALAAYRALAAAGEPEPVPDLPPGRSKVEPGASWSGVPALAVRLRTFGDLADGVVAGGDAPPVYNVALVEAVKHFQWRHGLESDGIIGRGTLRALNVPLARRVRQIELALERMRWLPALGDRPNVFVNVAFFRMWATDPSNGEEPLRMNVVAGKALDHKTPLFVEQMEYIVFRPYWNPPRSIIVKELVPQARRDPSYLNREELEIVASGDDSAAALPPTPENLTGVLAGRLFIRQRPGPKNALGLVKFIFPNEADVYMHGTPAPHLFARARRDFSHGCIRLENPARIAEWVLRGDPSWTRERIDAAMKGSRPVRVNLKQPLTVVVFYDTVHVNSDGVVFFVDDIYGHDRDLEAALGHGYPYPVARSS
jgi:murein L,D-transpeptidase YcbB/YkuD